MPQLRDIASYSKDIDWLISLIQHNDADGWLRVRGMLGDHFENEGREGDDLIPEDHEIAYTYLNQLDVRDRSLIESKMIEFKEPSIGDILREGVWESIRYLPKAVGGMTSQWVEGLWGSMIDRRREAERRGAQRRATREGRGEEFADMYREPGLPENYQRFKNFSDGMIAELIEERERAYENDPHLRGYMRWAQENPVAINPFKDGFIGRPKIFARAISQMIPSATSMLMGVGAAVATKSPFAGVAVSSTLMGFLEGTDEFQQAIAHNLDMGLDMDEATDIAVSSSIRYAVASTFLESLPMGRFFRLMNPARKEALRSGFWQRIHNLTSDKYRAWRLDNPKSAYQIDMMVTQAVYESIQEFSQYLTQVAIQTGYKDENFLEIYDKAEAGESAYAGAIMGGMFGGGAYLANRYLGNIPSDRELEIREENANDEIEVHKGPLEEKGTLLNYLKQVLAPQIGKRRFKLVDVEQDSPVEELISRHKTMGGEIGQKVGDIIRAGGMKVYESLTPKEQVFVENVLKGMLIRRSPELARAVGDPVRAVAEDKIRISRLKPAAALLAGQQRVGSMVRVMEDQITQDWLRQYPASLIQQELRDSLKRGLTASALSKWAEGHGIDIKGTMEKEFIKSMREQARIENLEPGSMEQHLLSELEKAAAIEFEIEALNSLFGAPLGVDQATGQLIALADDASSDSDVQAQDAPGNKAHVVDGPYKGQEITFAVQPPEIANDEVAVELPDGEIVHLKKNQIGFIMPLMVDPEAAPEPPAMTDEEVEAAAGGTVVEGLSSLLEESQEEGDRGVGTYGIPVDVELADVEKAYWDGTKLVTRADKKMDLIAAEEDAARTHLGEFEELAAKETYDSKRREWMVLEDTAVKIDFLPNENKVVFSMLNESFDKAYVFEQVSDAVEAVQRKLNLSSDTEIELKTNHDFVSPIETIADLLGEGVDEGKPGQIDLFSDEGEATDDIRNKKERRAQMSQAVRDGLKSAVEGIKSLEPDPFSASMNIPRLTTKSRKVAAEHFEKMWNEFDTAWQIAFDDYVKAVFRAIAELPKKARESMSAWFDEWQNKRAEELGEKVSPTEFNAIGTWMERVLGGITSKAYREISQSQTMETIYNSIATHLNEELDQEASTEGLEIIDMQDMEDGRYSNTKLSNENYNFLNTTFMKFLGDWVSNEDAARVLEAVITKERDEFFTFVEEEFGFVPTTEEEANHAKRFWLANHPDNRAPRREKGAFNYSNIDEEGRLQNPHDPAKRWVTPKEGRDIKTGRNLSASLPVSFGDLDARSDGRQVYRIYTNDIARVYQHGETSDGRSRNFGEDDWVEWTPGYIRELNKRLGNFRYIRMEKVEGEEKTRRVSYKIPMTIIGIKGGNNPTLLMTKVTEEELAIGQDEDAWRTYWSDQLESDFITEEQHDQIISDSEALFEKGHNNIMSQRIAVHEFMKKKRYNEYMKSGDVVHHFRRMGLDFSDGAVLIGMGPSTVKIMDVNKVDLYIGRPEDGNQIPMVDYVAGLDEKYLFDGAIFTDEEFLFRSMDALGRVESRDKTGGTPLFELKTVLRYRSSDSKMDFGEPLSDGSPAVSQYYPSFSALRRGDKLPQPAVAGDWWDGVHYMNAKGNEFVPEPDLYFTEKGRPDKIVAYTAKDGRFIKIFDDAGRRVNQLMTTEEAKEPDGGAGSFKLDGRVATDVLTIPEDARRVIQITSPHSKPSSSSPISAGWADLMSDPEFADVRESLEDHLVETARAYLDMLYQMRDDTKMFKQYVRAILGSGTAVPREIEKLLMPDGKNIIENGFMHPHIISSLAPQIMNRMIKDGAYKGRRYGASTYVALKPDAKGEVTDPNNVILSVDNDMTWEYIKEKSGESTVEGINSWLESNETYILSSRFPIPDVQAVGMYRIQAFKRGKHGDVAWFHPDTIFGRKQGDFDGDHVTLEFLYKGKDLSDSILVDKIVAMQKTDSYTKNRRIARLEYFKGYDFPDYDRVSSVFTIMARVLRQQKTQGMITNAKTIRGVLAMKDFKAVVDGSEISVRKEDDIVMLGSKPLKDDVTQEKLDQIAGKDINGVIVGKDNKRWKSGTKYLRTTSGHEFSILLQAAVDHGKELLLSAWRFNGYDSLVRSMFKREDGKPLNSKQVRALKNLVRLFKYSPDRKGDSMKGFALNMDEMFERSREIGEHVSSSARDQSLDIETQVASIRRQQADKAFNPEKVLSKIAKIEKVSVNGKAAPIEKLLSIPHLTMAQYNKDNPDRQISKNPFHYPNNKVINAHVDALKNLPFEVARPYGNDIKGLSKSEQIEYEEAQDFAEVFASEFGELFAKIKRRNKKIQNVFSAQSFDYDESLNDLIYKYLNVGIEKFGVKAFAAMNERQQAAATILFLEGTARELKKQSAGIKSRMKQHVKTIDNKTKTLEKRRKELAKLEKSLPEDIPEGETKKYNATKKRIAKVEGFIENIKNSIAKLNENIEKLGHLNAYYRSRTRDVRKLPPLELMHRPTYKKFIEEFGRQLPGASTKPINLSKNVRLYESWPRRVLEKKMDEEHNC